MEWYWVLSILLLLLTLLIAGGVPLPFAMAGAALPFLLFQQGLFGTLLGAEMMTSRIWSDFVLLSVPLFILLGEIVGRSRIGPSLYQIMHRSVPIRGSAAYGSVGACAGFGAVCGSSMIGALTIGSIALPQMLRLGYSPRLAAGVVAAGGTLSVLIPPSLIMLFYGILTGTSIGDLFIAGIVPGLILTGLFFVVVGAWRYLSPQAVPAAENHEPVPLRMICEGLLPVLGIGMFIILSIYFGIATPTEAAAIGALASIFLGRWPGGMTMRSFSEALLSTMRTMGFLGILLTAALLFGYVLTVNDVPQEVTELFLSLEVPKSFLLIAIVVFFLILGMFLETVSITFIAVPAIFPIVIAFGFDPVWFGVVFTITMEIAVLTPPVGLNLFVIQSLDTKNVSLLDVILGTIPFVLALLFLIVLLAVFPEIALWLPASLR